MKYDLGSSDYSLNLLLQLGVDLINDEIINNCFKILEKKYK